jgi:hypothetical protein
MLVNLINQHALAEAHEGKWDAVAEILNAATIAVRNPKSWTMADLVGLVGSQGAALVGGTIQAAGASNPIFAGAWIALNVTGLQLHTDDRQSMIDGLALAGKWPAELAGAVKSAGLTYTSLAGNPVIAEECEAAWVAYQFEVARSDRRALYDAFENAVGTNEQSEKIAEMRAMLDVVEAV